MAVVQWAGREAALRHRKARLGDRAFYRENLFRLACDLKRLGVNLARLIGDQAAAEACRSLGVNPDDLFALLTDAISRVRVGREADAMSAAMRLADRDFHLFPVPEGGRPYYARILALAYHLSHKTATGMWAPFGSARIAEWLGMHRNSIDATVKELERLGLLRVNRDAAGRTKCSYSRGESRLVRYTGSPPAAPTHDDEPF